MGQSMPNPTDKPKLQDLFIMSSKIFIGDERNRPIIIGRSRMQEVVKE
jgi:hypothetical protein